MNMMALEPNVDAEAVKPIGEFKVSYTSGTSLFSTFPPEPDEAFASALDRVLTAVDALFVKDYYQWCNHELLHLRNLRQVIYNAGGARLWDAVLKVVREWAKVVVAELVEASNIPDNEVPFLEMFSKHILNWKTRSRELAMHLTWFEAVIDGPHRPRAPIKEPVIAVHIQHELGRLIARDEDLVQYIKSAIARVYEQAIVGSDSRGLVCLRSLADHLKHQSIVSRMSYTETDIIDLGLVDILNKASVDAALKCVRLDAGEWVTSGTAAGEILEQWCEVYEAWQAKQAVVRKYLANVMIDSSLGNKVVEKLCPQLVALLWIDSVDSIRESPTTDLSTRPGLASFKKVVPMRFEVASGIAKHWLEYNELAVKNISSLSPELAFEAGTRLLWQSERYANFLDLRDHEFTVNLVVSMVKQFGDEIANTAPRLMMERLHLLDSTNSDLTDLLMIKNLMAAAARLQAKNYFTKTEETFSRLLHAEFLPREPQTASSTPEQLVLFTNLRRTSEPHMWWKSLVRNADLRSRTADQPYLLHQAAWETKDDKAVGEVIPAFASFANHNGGQWPPEGSTVQWHNGWSIASVSVGEHTFTCSFVQYALIDALAKATSPMPLDELLKAVPVDSKIAQVALADILELGKGFLVWNPENNLFALNPDSPEQFDTVYRVRLAPLEPDIAPSMWRKPPAKRPSSS